MITIFKKPRNSFFVTKTIIIFPLIAVGAYILILHNKISSGFMNGYILYLFSANVAMGLLNGIEELKKTDSRKSKAYFWFGMAFFGACLYYLWN